MEAPRNKVLRLGTGNIYVGNNHPRRAVQIAKRTRSHSWAWQEMFNATNEQDALKGMTSIFSLPGFKNFKDSRDCQIMLRSGLTLVHHSVTEVSRARTRRMIDHNRVAAAVAYDFRPWNKTIFHMSVHPNWVQNINSGKVVVGYVEAVNNIENLLQFARDMGWVRFATGDYNLSEDRDKRFRTLYDVFEAQNMKVRTNHLDGMAFDRIARPIDTKFLPPNTTGSDTHPWIVTDFVRR